MSGAYSERPALAKAIQALGNGDTLVVVKLDRVARSTRDLLNILDAIAKAGASFKSLGDPWCDTTSPHGELMVTVLGGLATFERLAPWSALRQFWTRLDDELGSSSDESPR